MISVELIDEIKKYPCLYARGTFSFEDPSLVHRALIKMAVKFHMRPQEVKDCWVYLRERYKKEYKKRELTKNVDRKTITPWKYYHYLHFLAPFFFPKSFRSGRILEITETPSTNQLEPDTLNLVIPNNEGGDSGIRICIPVEVDNMLQDPVSVCYEQKFNYGKLLNDRLHGTFFKMIIEKLDQLTNEEQESSKTFFLNYLENLSQIKKKEEA